ncbi:aminoacyl-tRNA hydrolase [Alcaligenes sp. 13f]|uniref:aminoacyl-tRNA hydrolase n=1 Tax=Alcaligenes sp. 13f TaxID=2841924 RepID=UPI001CF685ED
MGRPPGRQDPADWVLDPFAAAERAQLPILVGDAADAVEQIIGEGLLAAQQRFHAPRA